MSTSDLTLRPGFLALLEAWTEEARGRMVPLRVDVGHPWTFVSTRDLSVEGPLGSLPIARDGTLARAVPALVGAYQVKSGGRTETRVAAPVAAEMDLRPRATGAQARSGALGEAHSSVDVSWGVALVLLGLMAAELGFRVQRTRTPEGAS